MKQRDMMATGLVPVRSGAHRTWKALLSHPASVAALIVGALVIVRRSSPGKTTGSKAEDAAATSREDDLNKAAAWLAAGFATLTAAFTALGAVGGGLERMLLNYFPAALVALIGTIGGVLLAVAAYLAKDEKGKRRRLRWALVLFSIGVVTGIVAAARTPSTREQPFIAAKLSVGTDGAPWVLEATVKAAGMRSHEKVKVVVDGLDGYQPVEPGGRLYTGEVGPDRGGLVDLTFTVPVPINTFEQIGVAAGVGNLRDKCFEEEEEPGAAPATPSPEEEAPEKACVVLVVPPTEETTASPDEAPAPTESPDAE